MTTNMLSLSAQCDRRLVAAEVSSQRTLEWIVAVPDLPRRESRAPLNLALILDRSGSMQGDKLRYVQQAACHVLDMLDERDRIAVVAYDDQVTLIAHSQLVSEPARAELKRKINDLRPGGWTDLSGGWLEGCREVADRLTTDGVNRALLLTDGLANRGITDVEELTHHARELRHRGVSTSTFGVGLDFNENLLEALAEQGGGHFYYIERPDQIPVVFRRELGELLTVVAREAFLSITVPSGVALELLGDLPHERLGQRLRIFLGDLCAGERRALYTRVLTPPDAPGTSVLLRGELGYADLDGRTTTVIAEIGFSYAREAEVLLAPLQEAILQRAGEIELAAATARALKLERAGQRQQAQAVIQQSLAAHMPYMPAPAAAAYQALAGQIEQGLSEDQRKETHFAAYRKRQSRSY
ncbi:MAG TPA: VWA domain-containing protein [Roseiflexaceae bacterium]|nr:VWA domain-containing protein [Roseiflexaceae bacterium]